MAENNKMLIEFAARIDASLNKSMDNITKMLGKLNGSIAKANGTMQQMNTQLAKTISGMGAISTASQKATTDVIKQSAALEKQVNVSDKYISTLSKINQQYREGSALRGTALRALEKTEAAYNRETKAIRTQQAELKRLQEQVEGKSKVEVMNAKGEFSKVYDPETAKNIQAINTLEKSLKNANMELDRSFNYSKQYASALVTLRTNTDATTKAISRYAAEQPAFQKIAEKITETTKAGSSEQRAEFGALNKMIQQYDTTVTTLDRKIKGLSGSLSTLSGAQKEAVVSSLNAVTNERAKLETAMQSPLSAFDNFKAGVDRVANAVASVNVKNREFASMVNTITEAQKKGIVTSDAAIKRIGDIGKADKVVANLGATYKKTSVEMDAMVKAVGAESIVTSAAEKNMGAMTRQMKEQLSVMRPLRTEFGFISDIAQSTRSMAAYGAAISGLYALFGLFGKAKTAVIEYNQSLKDLQAITQATDSDIATLSETILDVASKYKYSLNEVADAAKVIGQAGFSASETMSVLESAVTLAQGTMSKMGETTDLITTSLTAFQEEGLGAAEAADVLAQAVNLSKLDIEKMRTVFNYVGPVANDAGVSFQETASALMVLANQGMRASTIGTSLRNIFARLESPSAKLRDAFKGNEEELVKMTSSATTLAEKFRILGTTLGANADLYDLFGLRAAGAVSILIRFPDAIEQMNEALYEMGMSERMAEKQMEGLSNKISNLGTLFEVFAVAVGQDAGKGLGVFVDILRSALSMLTTVSDNAFGRATVAVVSFSLAIGAAVTAVRVLAAVLSLSTVSTFISGMASARLATLGVATAAGTATVATTALTGALSFISLHPIGAAFTALAVAIGAVAAVTALNTKKTEEQRKETDLYLKTKQEELDLLSRAAEANAALSEDSLTRTLNKYYVMDRVIGAEVLRFAKTKDEVSATLAKLKTTTAQDITDTLVARIKVEQEQVIKLRKSLMDSQIAMDAAEGRENGPMGITESRYAGMGGSRLQSLYNTTDVIRKKMQDDTSALKESTDKVIADIQRQAEALRKMMVDGEISLSGFEAQLNGFIISILTGNDAIDNTAKATAEVAISMSRYTQGMQQMAGSVTFLQDAFNAAGVEGANELLAIYEKLPSRTQAIFMDMVKRSQDALDRMPDNLTASEQSLYVLENQRKLYAELIELSGQYADQAQTGLNLRMENELMAAQELSDDKKEFLIEELMIKEKYYMESKRMAEEAAAMEIAALAATQQVALELEGLPKSKVIELIIQQNLGALSPILQDFVMGNAADIQRISSNVLTPTKNVRQVQEDIKFGKGGGRTSFGSAEKKKIEALKAQLDAEQSIQELAYERGLVSHRDYLTSKMDMERRLLSEREEQVTAMEAKAVSEEDRSSVEKQRQQLVRDRAKFELDVLKETRDFEIKQIEDVLKAKEMSSNTELALIDKTSTHYMDIARQEHDAAMATITARIEGLNQQARLEQSEDARKALDMEYQQANLDIIKEQAAYKQKLYEESVRYMEYEYRMGIKTTAQYKEYIEYQRLNGSISDYEAIDQQMMASNNFIGSLIAGIHRAKQEIMSFGESVAEVGTIGFQGLNNVWDALVESWHDDTVSFKDAFADVINTMIMDMEKMLMKNFMQTVLFGGPGAESQGLFGGLVNGLGSMLGGGAAVQAPQQQNNASLNAANLAMQTAAQQMASATMQGQQGMLNLTLQSAQSQVSNVAGMANTSTNIFAQMGSGVLNMMSSIGNGLFDFLGSIGGGGGGGGFMGFLGNVVGNLFGGIFGGGGSFVGPPLPKMSINGVNVLHSGGRVGKGRVSRSVNAAIFADAERYHAGGTVRQNSQYAGLAPGEVPIIAKEGEKVITEKQANENLKVVVNVNNMAPKAEVAGVQQKQGSNGQWDIDILVQDIDARLGGMVKNGTSLIASSMDQTRGLSPSMG